MWMSPLFTRGSKRTASTPSAIHRSLLSLSTNPWVHTLASPLSTFFHPLACFTPSCPFVAVTNSPFLGVVLVSRKSRPNLCCNARTTAITGTSIGCYAVLGAPLSWSNQWKRITSYTKYMKYGIFPEAQRWTGVFADYVNTWLKIKKESAGWPSWCQTVVQKREYILRYQERKIQDAKPKPS